MTLSIGQLPVSDPLVGGLPVSTEVKIGSTFVPKPRWQRVVAYQLTDGSWAYIETDGELTSPIVFPG